MFRGVITKRLSAINLVLSTLGRDDTFTPRSSDVNKTINACRRSSLKTTVYGN